MLSFVLPITRRQKRIEARNTKIIFHMFYCKKVRFWVRCCINRIEERNIKVLSYSSYCRKVRFGMFVRRELSRETPRLSFILLVEKTSKRDRRENHFYLLHFLLQEGER
jgi:hypothetical protein